MTPSEDKGRRTKQTQSLCSSDGRRDGGQADPKQNTLEISAAVKMRLCPR